MEESDTEPVPAEAAAEHEEEFDGAALSDAAEAAEEETSDIRDDTVMTSGYSGTVQWVLYQSGHLTIRPVSGDTGEFESFSGQSGAPWSSYSDSIKTVSFEGTIYGAENMNSMFYSHHALIGFVKKTV